MSKQLTTARPYTKALFSSAVSQGTTQDWVSVLAHLCNVIADQDAQHFIGNPKVSDHERAEFFVTLTEASLPDLTDDLKEKLNNFIFLLCEHDRLSIIPDIYELYQQMLSEQEGEINVIVFSATVLDDAHQTTLQKALGKRFGSKIKMQCELDPSLIGGVLVRSDNWVLDGSVKGKLARLNEILS